jgi:hypothetical protein
MNPQAAAAILAGGRSRRMGVDKALLPLGGTPLIGHVLARLRPLFQEIMIVGDPTGSYRRFGVPVVPDPRPAEGPLTGRQYVITGTLEGYSREQAKAALEALGAKVSDSVSKRTTGVIVGESPGSKAAKAEKAGVPILGEADLRELLATTGSTPGS